MISKILNSRIFLIILSVALAITLFVNATSTTARNEGKNVTEGQVFSVVLEDIPIDIRYDEQKYFISGYTSTAEVSLTSYNQIELLQEKSADKRSFKLIADLTSMSVGTYTVPLSVEGLSRTVNAKTDPGRMSVTIEDKETKNFKVNPIIDSSLIPDGYDIGGVTLSSDEISVTAGTKSIKNIARVESVLPSSADLKENPTVTVALIAVDDTGRIVPAKLDKSTVKMTVELVKIKGKAKDTSGGSTTSSSSTDK